MTLGAYELFLIQCEEFKRNLRFFASQTDDDYVKEMLDDMVQHTNRYEVVIGEAVPEELK